MPLRFFHKIDDANGNAIINAFEDWLAEHGFDLGPQTFLSFLKNAAGASAPLTGAEGPLESIATAVPANSPLHYFLKVNGATGDATLKGFEGWFSVDGFDWGAQNTTSIGSASGGGAGKTTFSPLTVDIHSLAGLATLFGDAARGENLGTVELAAVDTVRGQSLEVYDIKLSDVVLGGFENDPGPNGVETALAFDFGKIAVTVQPPTQNGRPGVPQTSAFDVTGAATDAVATDFVANAAATQAPLASAATPVPANSPLHYFLKVDGVTGDSTVKGFEGWFSVDGYDLGVQNTSSPSSSTGAGAGKAQFSPLTVDIHSLTGLASLFGDAATGHVIPAVQLVGVETIKGQSQTVYDIKLSDVSVGGFENDPGPNGVETALAFNFARISVTDRPQQPNGSLGTPQTATFDLKENATDATLAASNLASTAVATDVVSLASAATPVPASSPLHYFLKVDGVTGDSTVKGFEGWFSVDGYDLGVQNTSSPSSSTGAGAGKAQFSPLTVDIHSLTGLASLFGDAATGHVIPAVQLVGVETIKGQSQTVYDIKLSDVSVGGFENDPGPLGVETALAFNFAKISVTDRPQQSNGSLGVPQTATFDLKENATDATLAASNIASTAVTTDAVSLASAATPVPASSPLHYFLKVDGVTGDSTVKGFEGWFSVDGYDLGVQNTSSPSSSTGAGAGKAQFSPLTVDIHSLTGLASLFGDAASGHVIPAVQLVGVETIKGQSQTVYDIKLSDVSVGGFENDPGPLGVETALAFNFARISVTDRPQQPNGSLGVPQTATFDLKENATDATLAASNIASTAVATDAVSLASAATPVPANSPLHYFLKVDGVTGDSTVKGFEGWFSVDGYDLGVQNTSSPSSSTGAGAGKAQFSPLTVDIHSLTGLASLFGDAATGHVIPAVQLVGVETIKGQSQTVYDIKLSDVSVGGFENDPGPLGVETALAFNFAKISVTDRPQQSNGSLGVPQTATFDLKENATDATLAASNIASTAVATDAVSLASAATPVPASSPLHYFLKVDGVTGDSTVKGFEGWFSVDGYDLGVQNTSSPSSSTGAGAGKAQFSPLTVDIHSLTGLASLFGDAATGHVIPAVQLVGVETIKGQSQTVYDIKLSDVSVGGFENDPGPNGVETALAFNFARISVTDRPPRTHGRLGTPQTSTFDLKENAASAALSPSDLLFNGTTSSPASLMAASDTGLTGPSDLVFHPTLTTHA